MEIDVLKPVDYLLFGHITVDITSKGPRLGGTAVYSALTARALGLRVGVVTSWGSEISMREMDGISVINFPSERSTTFENRYSEKGRQQYLRHRAPMLDIYQAPEPWRNASIVHLGPVAQEVEPAIIRSFPGSFIGVTPQGWLRDWDAEGRISPTEWPEAAFVLEKADAAVLSIEDLGNDEDRMDEMAAACRVLAVTEGHQGCRLYWHGDVRRFRPDRVKEADPTGAGDVFAAAFFIRLYNTRDPWESARFATQISAISVTRMGLEGIPTTDEINASMIEVF